MDRTGYTARRFLKNRTTTGTIAPGDHEHFGFAEDNYMGALPQYNAFTKPDRVFYQLRLQLK
jgi:hypothetical protein